MYWNPLHPAVALQDALRILVLYYSVLAIVMAVVGADVISGTYTSTVSLGAMGVGVVKAWQRRFSPVASLGGLFRPENSQE